MRSDGTVRLSPKQLMELDACTECGECTHWCEAFDGAGEEFSAPMARILHYRADFKASRGPAWLNWLLRRAATDAGGRQAFAEGLYRCTLCARCVEACPARIDLASLWYGMRQEAAAEGLCPARLQMVAGTIEESRNVLGYPQVERGSWVDYMEDAPRDGFRRDRARVLYYVGCMTSFSPAAQRIAESLARILAAAGVDFAILGEDEWCCGFPLRAAGYVERAEPFKEHNIEQLSRLGADTVVFNCPSCFLNWSRYYRPDLPGVRLVHATEFVAELLREGRLAVGGLDLTVTYHDPCDLGRNMGVYGAPRRAIESLPGVRLAEAENNRRRGLCCGGGGDLEIVDVDLAGAIADRTGAALEATGAQAVVSACPECLRQLSSSARRRGSGVEVLDLCELVARGLRDGREPVRTAGLARSAAST